MTSVCITSPPLYNYSIANTSVIDFAIPFMAIVSYFIPTVVTIKPRAKLGLVNRASGYSQWLRLVST